MTRRTKTPAQRAQEALDVAQRRVDRLQSVRAKADADLTSAGIDLDAAVKRRDFLAGDPDLPAAGEDRPAS